MWLVRLGILIAVFGSPAVAQMAPPPPPPPPPVSVIAKLGKLEVQGDRVVFTALAGYANGVGKDWRCHLVHPSGTRISGGACAVVRIEKGYLVANTQLAFEQAKLAQVELTAP